MKPLRYTEAESKAANKAWKATCGPHAIAAACGKTLEEVRAAFIPGAVNYRGWMSPTQVERTLGALNVAYDVRKGLKTQKLCNGINRVQWEGKWLNPGVPPRVAYFHTHLVAHFDGVVLCTCCLVAEWVPAEDWRSFVAAEIHPFHVTHHWELV
jgi:hypothetical protein